MSDSLFQKLAADATTANIRRNTERSMRWFLGRLKGLQKFDRAEIMSSPELIEDNRPVPGKMFMYLYDPKLANTLPFYDKFPLTIIVGPAPGGFHGLNLHYLEPRVRARFLDRIMHYANSRRYDARTKVNITYRLLKGTSNLREFAPCFKHYLASHIKSSMVMVPMNEWDIATMLPTADFKKSSAQFVWSHSFANI